MFITCILCKKIYVYRKRIRYPSVIHKGVIETKTKQQRTPSRKRTSLGSVCSLFHADRTQFNKENVHFRTRNASWWDRDRSILRSFWTSSPVDGSDFCANDSITSLICGDINYIKKLLRVWTALQRSGELNGRGHTLCSHNTHLHLIQF